METVEKEADSILGESPSPSKQVERVDYTLVSPAKFTLKVDLVEEVDEVSSDEKEPETSEEMSSHDLTAEEESKDYHLNHFVDETSEVQQLDS